MTTLSKAVLLAFEQYFQQGGQSLRLRLHRAEQKIVHLNEELEKSFGGNKSLKKIMIENKIKDSTLIASLTEALVESSGQLLENVRQHIIDTEELIKLRAQVDSLLSESKNQS